MEYRAPDATANPYLAFAALLAAGLDGIQKKLKPANMVSDNVFHYDSEQLDKVKMQTMPTNLKEAIGAAERDDVISEVLGEGKERYLEIKEKEWQEYSMQVSEWEVKRYL
jgi:glutamine synthetase